MEMEFYVNMNMHVYVYVCVRGDSRDLEAGRVFARVFFLGTLKKLSASFRFFFPGTRVFYLKSLPWRDFFYSIIASCLIEFLASRSLTLSTPKQDDSVHSISLLTGGHRSRRIPFATGGEEVQH